MHTRFKSLQEEQCRKKKKCHQHPPRRNECQRSYTDNQDLCAAGMRHPMRSPTSHQPPRHLKRKRGVEEGVAGREGGRMKVGCISEVSLSTSVSESRPKKIQRLNSGKNAGVAGICNSNDDTGLSINSDVVNDNKNVDSRGKGSDRERICAAASDEPVKNAQRQKIDQKQTTELDNPSSAHSTTPTSQASASQSSAPSSHRRRVHRYPLTVPQTRWLAYSAFVYALQRKASRAAHLPIIRALRDRQAHIPTGKDTGTPAQIGAQPHTSSGHSSTQSSTQSCISSSQRRQLGWIKHMYKKSIAASTHALFATIRY